MTEFAIASPDGTTVTVSTPKPMDRRDLDSIYSRACVNGKFESRCLTDLPWEICEYGLKWKAARAPDKSEYLLSVIEHLHDRLRTVGDTFDVVAKSSEEGTGERDGGSLQHR